MRLRLHGHSQTEDGRDINRELRRHILTLWQTALIRLSRLKIQDEIETGLRYYQAAFFEGSDGPKMREAGWNTLIDRMGQTLADEVCESS